MANPSSSHRDRDRSSSHRHHRTISSTTLLLVLSLVLAVLAVMLTLPQRAALSGAPAATAGVGPNANHNPISHQPQGVPPIDEAANQGILGYITPKRSQALVQRERDVALREADIARREADLLTNPPAPCPPCMMAAATTEYVSPPVQTVIKEIFREDFGGPGLVPPNWQGREAGVRWEDVVEREVRLAEREKEIGRREEGVNRREHEASRREAWIMEQVIAMQAEDTPAMEEEYIYEQQAPIPGPGPGKRKAKELAPPTIHTSTITELQIETQIIPAQTQTKTQTKTVTVPAPANTRYAATPSPEIFQQEATGVYIPRTTAVEVLVDEEVVRREAPPPPPPPPPVQRNSMVVEEEVEEVEEYEDEPRRVRVVRHPKPRSPKRWFGGW